MAQYKVEFLPQNLVISRGGSGLQTAAQTIEGIINQYASQGWDLSQIGQISVAEKPGCLAGIFGAQTAYSTYNMLVFRKGT